MSWWEDYQVGEKIIEVLKQHKNPLQPHLGKYIMLSAYQIAILFKIQYKEAFFACPYKTGGRNIGEETSLAQQIALWLSRRIKDDVNMPVDGLVLSKDFLVSMNFENPDPLKPNEKEIIESSMSSDYAHTFYRYKD